MSEHTPQEAAEFLPQLLVFGFVLIAIGLAAKFLGRR